MEWMRCNSCWLKVEEKQSLFHLTQCGHVYCDKCIMKAEEKCFQCGSVGKISLPLNEPLSPQIAHYFTRPTDLLEKVIQAEQFQESQLALCLKRADASDTKYQSLKEAYWVSAENLKKVVQKYNKLKMTINLMEKEKHKSVPNGMYAPSSFRTPPNQANNPKCNSAQRKNEVFRVPSVSRAPRSVGYFTASSTSTNSSNYRMAATPQSNYSHY
ncbi:RING finger protein 212B-like isoform X2 [Phymastichus coffea]|uniref:RING finger protein 212B-like isoform X2 n=1 Tax=Phymastichus coffea TaxID=108790 RepID=UPI00273B3104|nr:RING finger protein 212B-like isoform X2 [Phymastichus coffea]